MTWSTAVYGLWGLAALAAVVLWLASVRAWRAIGRPSSLIGRLLSQRAWLRILVVLAWVWWGVHTFAR